MKELICCPNCGHSVDLRHGMYKTKFYTAWANAKARCNNKNSKGYKDWGGRGIKVCDRWKYFLFFKEDMYESYLKHVEKYGERNTTLDRTDNNGNYEPSNCRWITNKEQAHNKRKIN